jgi:hypothetical protein
MSPELVSSAVALLIAVVIGLERGLRMLRERSASRAQPAPLAIIPPPVVVAVDPNVLQGLQRAIDKITEVLVELRTDHRIQDRRFDELQLSVRELRG